MRMLFAVLVALAMVPATASAALTAPQSFETVTLGGHTAYGYDWATSAFSSYDLFSGATSVIGPPGEWPGDVVANSRGLFAYSIQPADNSVKVSRGVRGFSEVLIDHKHDGGPCRRTFAVHDISEDGTVLVIEGSRAASSESEQSCPIKNLHLWSYPVKGERRELRLPRFDPFEEIVQLHGRYGLVARADAARHDLYDLRSGKRIRRFTKPRRHQFFTVELATDGRLLTTRNRRLSGKLSRQTVTYYAGPRARGSVVDSRRTSVARTARLCGVHVMYMSGEAVRTSPLRRGREFGFKAEAGTALIWPKCGDRFAFFAITRGSAEEASGPFNRVVVDLAKAKTSSVATP